MSDIPLLNNLLISFLNPFISLIKLKTYLKNILHMARVVKWKLLFMEWVFYNLAILIKLYEIQYLNLDKALLFPRNQAIRLKNGKIWRVPATTKFNIFCSYFAHFFYLTLPTKGCSVIFLILFRSWVMNKSIKITQNLNKFKKIPNTLSLTSVGRKRVQSFSKKYWTLW